MKFLIALSLGFLGLCFFAAAPANAQATRTWVSGVGDDANPCSRTAPCKTFAGAISKTAAAGEINCIDPGGFGGVTITKAIAIKCDAVAEAGVLVSGQNGIVVSAGVNDIVWLSGLDIIGLGPASNNTSLNGIKFNSGAALHVSNCTIRGFTAATDGHGILFAPSNAAKLDVVDTLIADNGGVGIEVKPAGAFAATVSIQRTTSMNNTTGFRANGSGGGAINISIVDSVAAGNSVTGINATSGTGSANVMLNRVAAINSGTYGLRADGATANLRFGYSTISGNGTATSTNNGGTLGSYGNNLINGNTIDTMPPVIPAH